MYVLHCFISNGSPYFTELPESWAEVLRIFRTTKTVGIRKTEQLFSMIVFNGKCDISRSPSLR